MTVKLEIAYIPIILPNHDHVWPNHINLTSSLHHQIDQTFPLLVDKKIITHIMFAGEREGLGTNEPIPSHVFQHCTRKIGKVWSQNNDIDDLVWDAVYTAWQPVPIATSSHNL